MCFLAGSGSHGPAGAFLTKLATETVGLWIMKILAHRREMDFSTCLR